jgi:enterochelin esterase-like enzyme
LESSFGPRVDFARRAAMNVEEITFRSRHLENERRLWVQQPADDRPAEAICILLDGEYYVQRMAAPAIIAEVQAAPTVPPFATIYVSHIDGPTRWRESFCNEQFARFISEDLRLWAYQHFDLAGDKVPIFLGGLSLTGLAAAHVALVYPDVFAGILCQSASFWWSDNWIVNAFRRRGHVPATFRLACGRQETTEYVEHGPALIQRTSQLACNRLLRDALLEAGCSVSYDEFDGGHDIASWQTDLPKAIAALLSNNARPQG